MYNWIHLSAKRCIQSSHVLSARWAVWIWKRKSFLKYFPVTWQRGWWLWLREPDLGWLGLRGQVLTVGSCSVVSGCTWTIPAALLQGDSLTLRFMLKTFKKIVGLQDTYLHISLLQVCSTTNICNCKTEVQVLCPLPSNLVWGGSGSPWG